ncbi:MAG: hypothetical protein QOF61_1858 [Acidobacteriota bacterium]|jgi:hypothetical protein|nr:hypothetical protein [Acidobacteriota bacterium]
MRIVAKYSFNGGSEVINERYPHLLTEIEAVIHSVKAEAHKNKRSKEPAKKRRMLFSPKELNKAFKDAFKEQGVWRPVKIPCNYSTEYYVNDYQPTPLKGTKPYREMDFVKEKLGVEVQFGKYAFMVYNVCAKMTIFKNLGHIDCGVEIVPVRGFTKEMSTGVAYFEQFTWDLKERGVGSIDIPVLILGINADVLISTKTTETTGTIETEEVIQAAGKVKADKK